MQRTEATKKRRKEAEERIEAKKEAERQKFLDSLAFDVRIPVEIDPIYDNKPVFKTEKSKYDLIRGAKGSRAIENSKLMAAQDATQERQIKMLQTKERLKKQQQIVEDEEQEL